MIKIIYYIPKVTLSDKVCKIAAAYIFATAVKFIFMQNKKIIEIGKQIEELGHKKE